MKKDFLTSLFVFILSSFVGYAASHQEPRESNEDLRGKKLKFTLKRLQDPLLWELKATVLGHHSLEKLKGKKSVIRRIASQEAEKLDQFFVDKFIHLKYVMPSFKGKSCEVMYQLSLRGDGQKICKQEKEKKKEVVKILDFLKAKLKV